MVSVMATNGLKKQLENWNQINWKKVNKTVRNLRQRIFRARKRRFLPQVKKLAKVDPKELRQFTTVSSTYHPDKSWQSNGRN